MHLLQTMRSESHSLSRCLLDGDKQGIVAVHKGNKIKLHRFAEQVANYASTLKIEQQKRYALFHSNAYPFSVLLFALLHAEKEVWIAANNTQVCETRLREADCELLGEWSNIEILPKLAATKTVELEELSLINSKIIIFTSGSTGEPKAIEKSLLQLQREVQVLEENWGADLKDCEIVATVSHQHIYGLLFRVLWPLASGRRFHSQNYLSPDPLLTSAAQTNICWVASPAQLKRLDENSDWQQLNKLKMIFSSGGPLSQHTAEQLQQHSSQQCVEIYGSSESGGIAWRQSVNDSLWTPLAGVNLNTDNQGRCQLRSPFLADNTSLVLDDRIELKKDGRFRLLGRLDRVVKIEEKRLSLNELEQTLCQSEWIDDVCCLLVEGPRDRIAAAVCLNENGKLALKQQQRLHFLKRLRAELMTSFEAAVLPRKWLFLNHIPLNIRGKTDRELLHRLFNMDTNNFPRLQSCDLNGTGASLTFCVQPALACFQGHFPGQPILPGIAQLAWAENYGQILFDIQTPFISMEVIKFKKIVRPQMILTMTLEWKKSSGKLYFDLSSAQSAHSSGRMLVSTA